MNRKVTNAIRFFLDEFLPPIIRDNRFFMYPLFFLWYKGKNVKKLMEFKEVFHSLNHQEFQHYYEIYDSLPNRETDLATGSLDFIKRHLRGEENSSVIDIGCGSGFLLNKLHKDGYKNLAGVDMHPPDMGPSIKTFQGNIEALPFEDKSFDIVMCHHVLEHVLDVDQTVRELKRICKRKLIVTIPCQRYNRYTFELHINFFPQKSYVLRALKCPQALCEKIDGDWSVVAKV